MKIYCDSSLKKACVVVEGQEPTILPYTKEQTNNSGEYKAVILALAIAIVVKLEEVEVLTDSQLVAKQVSGEWACRAKHLLPLRDRVREFAQLTKATIRWIPREENLAGKALE